jgi:multiple sugar transport system ATP-binding protein
METFGNSIELPRQNVTYSSSKGKNYVRLPEIHNEGALVATITLNGIDKVYENGFQAVTDLSLAIADGEFLVLVGPSGCGKSTALRMIAGLESITGGEMSIGDRIVNDLEPKERDIAMVFQSYALYPHLTVRDNIAFALKLAKVPKDEIERRVNDAARTLELTENLDRRPAQLSGGQRQRVAMGRAIVRQPQAFLMDEPLSNLDAKLRVQMRAEIAKLQHDLNITTVYVTHDQIEAMTMGDRVAVMSKGSLMQVDSPQNLYDRPDNLFVAAFIGSPQMNLLRGMYNAANRSIALGSSIVSVPARLAALLDNYDREEVAVGLRPEHLTETTIESETESLRGVVSVREGLGSEVILHIQVDALGVDNESVRDATEGHVGGQTVTTRLPPTTKLLVGDAAVLAVDASQMHLFDLTTGLAIR